MAKKLPSDAFAYYLSLGVGRSHEAVGAKYGVTKRTVTRRAAKECWAKRVEEAERKGQRKAEAKATESIAAMHERHIMMLRAVQTRALRAVQDHPLTSGIQGMRMVEMAIKMERLIRAEPNEQDRDEKAAELAGTVRGFLAEMDRSVPKPEG